MNRAVSVSAQPKAERESGRALAAVVLRNAHRGAPSTEALHSLAHSSRAEMPHQQHAASVSRRVVVVLLTMILTTHSGKEDVVLTAEKWVEPLQTAAVPHVANYSEPREVARGGLLAPKGAIAEPEPGRLGMLERVRGAFVRWQGKERERFSALLSKHARGGVDDDIDSLLEELIGLLVYATASHLVFLLARKVAAGVATVLRLADGSKGCFRPVAASEAPRLLSPLATTSEDTVYIKEWDCKSSVKFFCKAKAH